jgi:sec-independent protein translocase protein TatB
MFDIGAQEILVIAVVAIIVIGPKDLPLAMRTAGRWIGKIRRVSNHFRAGIDAMIREAEMEDMEKQWREQNEKIMREHPGQEMTGENAAGTGPLTEETPKITLPEPEASAEAPAAPEGAKPQSADGGTPPAS